MIEQSYILGLTGGLMIGMAGAIYLLGNGRIMGASGIIGGLFDRSEPSEWTSRILFALGLIAAPWLVLTVLGQTAQTNITSNVIVIVASGFLVGLGSRIANGCTSGHGVCGMSRLSPRSFAATLIYLFAGAVTVLVFKHALGVI